MLLYSFPNLPGTVRNKLMDKMYFWCDSAVILVFLYQNTKETRLLLTTGTELGNRKLLQKHIFAQNKFYAFPPFLFKNL